MILQLKALWLPGALDAEPDIMFQCCLPSGLKPGQVSLPRFLPTERGMTVSTQVTGLPG